MVSEHTGPQSVISNLVPGQVVYFCAAAYNAAGIGTASDPVRLGMFASAASSALIPLLLNACIQSPKKMLHPLFASFVLLRSPWLLKSLSILLLFELLVSPHASALCGKLMNVPPFEHCTNLLSFQGPQFLPLKALGDLPWQNPPRIQHGSCD